MRSLVPRSSARFPRMVLFLALLAGALWLPFYLAPARPFLSNWRAGGLSGIYSPQLVATLAPVPAPGVSALEGYNQGSALRESVADQRVRYYRRNLAGGGTLAYFVVLLDKQVHIEVVNADGATPGSDATGDTIWLDGQRHLTTVEEIARAPYAARDKLTLVGAMAFGFHGDVRTSDEGTVVINGHVLRVNPRRAALCITSGGQAQIGLFDAAALRQCEQANGAGPVFLWQGKIANPDVSAETDAFIPFNPLGEDFVRIDWRKKVYSGTYPKSAVGIGTRDAGGSYLVLMISDGVTGVELARQLKAMGCTDALGGDDDSSAQAVWRGVRVRAAAASPVPDALAVYVRQ